MSISIKSRIYEIGLLLDQDITPQERRALSHERRRLKSKLEGKNVKSFADPRAKGPVPLVNRDMYNLKKLINTIKEIL